MSTQDEKVAETQQRLASLVRQTEGTTSKSLLIQTVALFECLLGMRLQGDICTVCHMEE
jgi:hypothetical protein